MRHIWARIRAFFTGDMATLRLVVLALLSGEAVEHMVDIGAVADELGIEASSAADILVWLNPGGVGARERLLLLVAAVAYVLLKKRIARCALERLVDQIQRGRK